MKVPYSWLKELVPDAPAPHEIAATLDLTGTQVELVEPFGVAAAPANGSDPLDAYRIGRVIEFEQHPNADRLRLCRVDVGEGEPRQIICGASNFAEGDTVAVVLPGGALPDGTKIGSAKLRGVESHGMMLSERELGLSTDHTGIMILAAAGQADAALTPGTPLMDVVPIADHVLHLEITSNRPDCLGVAGVAREVAASFDIPFLDPLAELTAVEAQPDAGATDDHVSVTLEAEDLCSRYMARAFTSVHVGDSPRWLKARLAAAGMRSINNVVDITNYVMLLTGQPLHAFDATKLGGSAIVVRRARDGEPITTLDDVERSLTTSDLVIADATRPAVIAGIMGAADVEVDAETTTVVLEAATFDRAAIMATSGRLGLRSESSSRFEKGLDPQLAEHAMRIATQMLIDLAGAHAADGVIDVRAAHELPQPPVIELAADYAPAIIGTAIGTVEQARILTAIGCGVAEQGETLRVDVPFWRSNDLTRPIDLVEEIARLHGLDKVPATLPARKQAIGVRTAAQNQVRVIEDALAAHGLREVITHSLVADGTAAQYGDGDRRVAVAHPMSAEHAELRTTLASSLLSVLARNAAVGQRDMGVFETGRTYWRLPSAAAGRGAGEEYVTERRVVAIAASGAIATLAPGAHVQWDVLALRALLEQVTRAAWGSALEFEQVDARDAPPWLHPGRAARVVKDGAHIGWLGELHPRWLGDLATGNAVVYAELELAAGITGATASGYTPISAYPYVQQDVAFIVPANESVHSMQATIAAAAGELLERAWIFDRYEGDSIGANKVSYAWRLQFRAPDRTLTDDDVLAARTGIISAMTDRHNASLRGA